jgi:hypothetical protein
MELDIIMLNEISQTQKEYITWLLHAWNLDF